MRSLERKRKAASDALIALRKAMGKTQQTFAVEVLKTAIGTIARYETIDPPRGDVLLRLGEIAREQELHELCNKFELLYIEDVMKNLKSGMTMIPPTEDEPARGYLLTSLSARALRPAHTFLRVLGIYNSDHTVDPDIDAAVSALHKALTKDDPLIRRGIDNAMLSVMEQVPPTSETSVKKGRKIR